MKMRIKILLGLLFFISLRTFAQNDTTVNSEKNFEIIKNMAEPYELEEDEKIFLVVKEMPVFPGGVTELRKWISNNVDYPADAREKGIQGTVYVRFQVKKDGSVGKIEVQKGVHELLDYEAIRVIKKLPLFKPGISDNGMPVSVWFSIPVTFKLS